MEPGSIEEIAARLKVWCTRRDRGLAKVEWDSVYSRQEVVSRLRTALQASKIRITELDVRSGRVDSLLERLSALPEGEVVSITGIEGLLPDPGERLEKLVALSFERERLASFPLRQIWWLPSNISDQFLLGVPDLDSWFQLRLHLTEILPIPHADMEWLNDDATSTVDATEARTLAERFFERSKVAKGRDVPFAQIWTDLGKPAYSALRKAGLIAEARQILAAALDLAGFKGDADASIFGDTIDPNGLESLRDFAEALNESGEYLIARRWLEQMVSATRRVFGDEHLNTIAAMSDLAAVLSAQGDLTNARSLGEQVLKSTREILGDGRETIAAMTNLAGTLFRQGNSEEAGRLEQQALDAAIRLLGTNHPETLRIMNNVALVHQAQGDLGGARWLQEQVLAARVSQLGPEHPDTLKAMNNLASTHFAQGDLAGARKLQEQVLSARSRLLGKEHIETVSTANNLANTLFAQGEILNSRKLHEDVLARRRRLLGEEHRDTLQTMHNLALTLQQQGDLASARKLQEQAVAGLRRQLGEDHPITQKALANLNRMQSPTPVTAP